MNLGSLRYFLGIGVARSKKRIFSHEKYVLGLLYEVGMLGCKAWGALINSNSKLSPDQEELLEDPGRYIWLVVKLIYLTVTRLIISFAVNVVR